MNIKSLVKCKSYAKFKMTLTKCLLLYVSFTRKCHFQAVQATYKIDLLQISHYSKSESSHIISWTELKYVE